MTYEQFMRLMATVHATGGILFFGHAPMKDKIRLLVYARLLKGRKYTPLRG